MEATIQNELQKTRELTDKRLLLAAALFGVFFSILFTRQEFGLNFILFVVSIYAAGWLSLKGHMQTDFKENPYAWIMTLPALLLSLCVFLYWNELVFLNILIVLVLVWAQFMLFTRKNRHDWFDIRFAMDFLMTGIMRLCGCFYKFYQHTFYFFFPGKKDKTATGGKIIFGVLAGLLLLFIIVPLLISADANMQTELDFLFRNIYFGDIFLYIFLFLLAASLCFGFFWSLKNDKPVYSVQIPQSQKKPLPHQSVSAALVVVAVVYVFFAAIQFKYLFSNYSTLMQTPGLTSSAYAVRGFAELIVITLLNFALMGLAMNYTKTEGRHVLLKILYLLLVVFNFVILYSSHLRLSLYEYSFGFTVGRFLPHLFLILFALLNAVMLVKVFRPQIRAMKYMLLTFIVFYTCINFLGIDRMVANINISRYYAKAQTSVEFDAAHLLTLSDDAMPVVADFITREIGNKDLFTIKKTNDAARELVMGDHPLQITVDDNDVMLNGVSLTDKIGRYKETNSRWPSLNLSRIQAQAAYERIDAAIRQAAGQ
jgi:hypothetical protein